MPWTAEQFRSRHNHKLSDRQAGKASRVANALLAKYGDEGKAIRIANSVVHKAAGGSTDFKGIVDGYAGGGKVQELSKWIQDIIEHYKNDPAALPKFQRGVYNDNLPGYQNHLYKTGFDPQLAKPDFDLMHQYGLGSAVDPDHMHHLIQQYGQVLPPDMQLFRGDIIDGRDVSRLLRPGSIDIADRARSTTLDPEESSVFGEAIKPHTGNWRSVSYNLQPGSHKVLPMPLTGQSEFVIPRGRKGSLNINRLEPNMRTDAMEDYNASGSIGPGYAPGGMVKAIMALLRPAEEAAPSKLDQLRAAYAKAHQNWLTSAPGGLGGIDTRPLSDYLRLAQEHVSGGDSINALANARAALDRSGVAARSANNPLMIGRARTKFGQQALGQLYDAHDYMNDIQSQLDPESHVAFPYPSRF